jgi:hypothetical protein
MLFSSGTNANVCVCGGGGVRPLYTRSLQSQYNTVCLSVPQISRSDARNVTLLNIQKQLTGFYKCEVSADAPLFHTEIKSAFMTVVGK